MIVWSVAERIAATIAGDPAVPARLPGDLADIGERAAAAVVQTTGLTPQRPLPAIDAVTRAQWARANVTIMKATVAPLEGKLDEQAGKLPGPLKTAAGSVIAAEAGALLGYMGRRVLGQYEVILSAEEVGEPRLLLVAPNLCDAAQRLNVPLDELVTWVTVHEVTHAVQFSAAPWLRAHLAGLMAQFFEEADVQLDARRLMAIRSIDDLRGIWENARTTGVIALLAGTDRASLLDQIQAAMALVEGHAEHVMDAAGAQLLDDLPRLRGALDHSRTDRNPLAAMLERLLGMEMKLRQYREGRVFCDAVVGEAGMAALNRAFERAEHVPTLAELRDPPSWISRVAA